MKRFRSGEQAPKTGLYTSFDRNGQNGGEIFLEKGQLFPQSQNEGNFFVAKEM